MSDPSEILKRRLSAIVEGSQDSRGLHFFCQIGGPASAHGMTTLQVAGTGSVLLGWRRDDEDEQQLFSVRFAEHDQARFYTLLRTHCFLDVSPPHRTRHIQEINVHIHLSDQKAGTWGGLQFWDKDMKEFPQIHELMYRVHRIIWAVSQGDIKTPLTFDV